jgi:hypothetical protein
MSAASLLAVRWLLHITVGGGAVLLLTCAVVHRLRQPARRQRVAEWGVVAALLLAGLCLAPSWLHISLPASDPQPVAEAPAPAEPAPPIDLEEALAALPNIQDLPADPVAEMPFVPEAIEKQAQERAPTTVEKPSLTIPASSGNLLEYLLPGLLIAYFSVAVYFLGRLAWGYWQLSRFLAAARPVPGHVWELFQEMTHGQRGPRLLTASGVRVPLSCGLFWPTIVLPELLCEAGDEATLRWVLAHELSHLRRRDALTSLLFGVGRAVYFFLPWFWWLRRQVRLCQEYVADAAAVAETGPVEGYAEFLLHWSAAPAVPAGAAGVSGHSSDLFRRITMLIRSPFTLEQRCPRRWSLLAGGALLSLAIVAAGVGLSQAARADETKDEARKNAKEEPKKEDPKRKEEPKKEEPRKEDPLPGFPDVEDLFKQLPGGLDDNTAKLLRQQLEMTRKLLEQMRKQGGAGGQLPGIGGGIVPLPGIGGGLIPNLQLRPRANRLGIHGMTEPRLGVRLDKPSATIVDQLDLPRDQGMIVEEIRDDSAAAKAGMKQHDILLELGGKPVPSDPQAVAKLLQGIKADEAVEAVVMRKSKKETLKNLKLPKMPEQQPGKNNPFRLNFEQPFGALNGAFNGGGNGTSTSITRTNNDFTIRHEDNGVTIGIRGTVNGGTAEATDIGIQDGEKTEKYTSVDKVPEVYRDKVKDLIQQAASGKVVKFKLNR